MAQDDTQPRRSFSLGEAEDVADSAPTTQRSFSLGEAEDVADSAPTTQRSFSLGEAEDVADSAPTTQRSFSLGEAEGAALANAGEVPAESASTTDAPEGGGFGKGFTQGAARTSGGTTGAAIGVRAGLAFGPYAPIAVPVLGAGGYMLGEWVGTQAANDIVGKEFQDDLDNPIYHGGKVFGDVTSFMGTLPAIARRAAGHLPDTWAGRFVGDVVNEAARGLMIKKQLPKIAEKLPKWARAVAGVHVPTRFTWTESVSGLGAAAGAAAAEQLSPGDALVRFGAEAAGGALAPNAFLLKHVANVGASIGDWLKKQTPTGREDVVSQTLRNIVEASGEDPEVLLKMLNGKAVSELIADFEGLPGTASTLMDSPALAQLEADLGRNAPAYMATISKQRREALQGIGRAISLYRGQGSSEALKAAVELKYQAQEMVIESVVEQAQSQAVTAAQKIAGDDLLDASGRVTPGKIQELSKAMQEEIGLHFQRLRDTETALWAKAFEGKGAEVASRKNMNIAYDDIRANRIASDIDLPPKLAQRMVEIRQAEDVLRAAKSGEEVFDVVLTPQAIANARQVLSVNRLLRTRTQLLQEIRQAIARGDDSTAELLGRMVDGVTEDIYQAGVSSQTQTIQLPTGGHREVRRMAKGTFTKATAYDQALAFTKAFKNVSARSFVGDTREKTIDGAAKLQPELILRRSMATGQELGDVRMKQIREFMEFTPEQMGIMVDTGVMNPQDAVKRVTTAQSNMLRAAAFSAVKPDGTISKASLNNFLKKHGDTLAAFPEIKEAVEFAMRSDDNMRALMKEAQGMRKTLNQGFAKNLGYDSISGALVAAFKNRTNPIERLSDITVAAEDSGPEAIESLRWSMWDIVFDAAKRPEGGFDVTKIMRALDDPIAPGAPSLREFMKDNGLITAEVSEKLDNAIAYASRILRAEELKPGDAPFNTPGTFETFFMSVLGAEGAKKAFRHILGGGSGTQVSSGPTLILAQRGANMTRAFFILTPQKHMRTILQDALAGAPLTPYDKPFSLLESLLSGPTNANQAAEQIRKVNIYMWFAGMHSVEQMELDKFAEEDTISP